MRTRAPGHYFEATAARILVRLGLLDSAAVELERVLPRLLAGTGPRWLAAVADLAVVAAAVGNRDRYRTRLAELAAELDEADRVGDAGRAEQAMAERDTLVEQLRRGVGLGGRSRTVGDEAELARVNVTRALRRAIEAISSVAPLCGAHLEPAIRTGRMCRYDPAGSGPRRWRV